MRFGKIGWGSWWWLGELCEVPRYLLWRGLRCHCPMCNIYCIFFNKHFFFIVPGWILSGQAHFFNIHTLMWIFRRHIIGVSKSCFFESINHKQTRIRWQRREKGEYGCTTAERHWICHLKGTLRIVIKTTKRTIHYVCWIWVSCFTYSWSGQFHVISYSTHAGSVPPFVHLFINIY